MSEASERFKDYVIENLLGVGGSGRVYRVYDPSREDTVALKVINISESDENATSRLRFRREFRAASRLDHPHLVKVYDMGIHESKEYYTMEFIEGYDFDDHLKHFTDQLKTADPLNDPRYVEHVIDLLIQISEALAYLHNHKFVHRDLKPGNVLVNQNNQVKLADFGLVKELGTSHMTRTGAILGTVEYMSPEQTMTAKVDCRSDIYSFGVMAFKALTGTMPFSGGIMRQLIARAKEEAPDPRNLNPNLNKNLAKILTKMLRRRPEERYPNAQLVYDDFSREREHLFGQALATTTSLTISAPTSIILPPACIGRDREIETMRSALEVLRQQKQSSLLVIQGETGIGKSRLAEEMKTLGGFHGLPFIHVGCRESGGWDYQPWRDLIDSIIDEMKRREVDQPPELSRIMDTLSDVLPDFHLGTSTQSEEMASPEAIRYRLFDAVFRFLVLESSVIPLILHIDNFHWAFDPSIELLQFITHRSITPAQNVASPQTTGRIILVITYNADELAARNSLNRLGRLLDAHDNVHFMELKRLTHTQVEDMIQSMLGGNHASPQFAEKVYFETSGNPLFIENIIQTLVEEGQLHRRGGIWVGAAVNPRNNSSQDILSMTIPTSIKESLRRRLKRLNDDEQHIIQAASILEQSFNFDQLMAVSDIDENDLLDALDILLRMRFLEEKSQDDEIYGFISNHVREIVQESLSSEQRSCFHKRAADFIKSEYEKPGFDILNQLAFHLSESGDRERAFPICYEVARELSQRGVTVQALAYIDRAMNLLPSGHFKEQLQLKLDRAYCMLNSGYILESSHIFRELIRTTSRMIKTQKQSEIETNFLMKISAESLTGLAKTMLLESSLFRATRIMEAGLERARCCEEIDAYTSVLISAAKVDMECCRYKQAVKRLQEALKNAANHQLKSAAADCYVTLGDIFFRNQKFKKSTEYFNRAHEMLSQIGNQAGLARVLAGMSRVKQKEQDLDAALEYINQSVTISERIGDTINWPIHLFDLATIQSQKNRSDEATDNYRKALAILEEIGNIKHSALCLKALGFELTYRKEFSEAIKSLLKAANIFERQKMIAHSVECRLMLAELMLMNKKTDDAKNYIENTIADIKKHKLTNFYLLGRILRSRCDLIDGNKDKALEFFSTIPLEKLTTNKSHAHYYFLKAELESKFKLNESLEQIESDYEKAIQYCREGNLFGLFREISRALGQHLIDSNTDPDRGKMILDELE